MNLLNQVKNWIKSKSKHNLGIIKKVLRDKMKMPNLKKDKTGIFYLSPILITLLLAFQNCDGFSSTPPETKAQNLTTEVMALSKNFQNSSGKEKDADKIKKELITKAKERRDVLLKLMETNPTQALETTLSEDQRAEMPAEVQAIIEQKINIKGEFEAIYEEDFAAGSARLRQFVKTSLNQRYELHIAGKGQNALTSQRVQLQGLLFPQDDDTEDTSGELLLDDSGILVMGATGGDNGGSPAPLPNTFGERKTIVMMINFQDVLDEPWTTTQMQDMFYNQASSFFMENSYGQTWLGGDVTGWHTLPVNGSTSCPSNFLDVADSVVEASGVDLSTYSHHVYLIPPTSFCARDSSTVGGTPSRTRIRSAENLRVVTHELGHALGLGHANALDCEGGVLETNCKNAAYGDIHDVMGKNFGHLNAFHKEKLGWLGFDKSPPISTITTGGTYIISPLEVADSKPKALKIWKGLDPATGKDSWYYLEYRQPIGYDIGLFETRPYYYPDQLANGVVVHSGVHNAYYSFMLDMTPDSASTTVYDLQDPVLEIGYKYYDAVAGITITPLSNDISGITVSISFDGGGGSETTANSPPVANNDSASTNENTTVTINVLANDSDPDGDALSVTSLSGINGSAKINSDGTVTYTPPSGFSGTETFSYSISDGKGGSASANVTVTVENTVEPPPPADTTVPTVVITNPVDGEIVSAKSTITITANASDDVKVSKVDFYVNASLICSDTTLTYSCSYSVPGGKSKNFIIEAKAFDSSGNSASHQIQVSSGSSTSDNGNNNGKGNNK